MSILMGKPSKQPFLVSGTEDIKKSKQQVAWEASQAKDKAEAEKVIADKEAADIKAEKDATALRKRRRATYPYKTVGAEAGLLSGAPVLLKSLLGQ